MTADGTGAEKPPLLLRTWKSPFFRYALLAPTVLSVLANIDDIGAIATWIVDHWVPLLNAVELVLAEFLPGIPANLRMLFLVWLFFLPFAVEGVIRVVLFRQNQVTLPLALLPTLLGVSLLGVLSNGKLSTGQIGSDLLIGAALWFLMVLVIPLMSWFITGKWSFWSVHAFSPPVAALVVFSIWLVVFDFGTGALLLLTLPLPAFAPRRLFECLILGGGIVLISIAYDATSDWLATFG